jgi:hypothetical protein
VVPPQEENGRQMASEVHIRIFSMSLMSVDVGGAVVDQSTVQARRAMPVVVGRRVQKV